MKFLKKNYLFILSFIFFVIFLFLLKGVLCGNVYLYDKMLSDFIVSIRNDNFNLFFKIITECGGTIFLIVLSIIFLIIFRKNKDGIFIASNLAGVALISQIFKFIVKRDRPVNGLILESGFSFPSGHSTVNVCFYGFLIYLIIRKVNNKLYRCLFIGLIILLIMLIGFSRLYLGVHYLSDVLAGISLGLSCLFITIYFYQKYNNLQVKN